MTEGEQNLFKDVVDIYVADFLKGCSDSTRQMDSGTGRIVDLCSADKQNCHFYDGSYQTHGMAEPVGHLFRFDCGIGRGVQVGFCRLQVDAVRVGPIGLFDKRWIRPTPKEGQV